ncbi:MAG: transcription-repair coupling factor, partial [Burkholderiaceae bacterium]|nr:transcription-repair coupling factor [Burkholderiaceae bacterium]
MFELRAVLYDCSAGRLESIRQLIEESNLGASEDVVFALHPQSVSNIADFIKSAARFGCCISPLFNGFVWQPQQLLLITEAELFTQTARQRRSKETSLLNMAGPKEAPAFEEFLHLVYAHDATLYVPVQQLHQVTRYAGADPDSAPLHQLGSGQWDKAKRKAAQQIRDTAAELLNLYAARAIRKGHAFEFSAHDYAAFSESFGFEETPDQAN